MNDMNYEYIAPSDLTSEQIVDINDVASAGFGQSPEAMLVDTVDHVNSAEVTQLAYHGDRLTAFSLYRRQLWL